MKIAVVVSSDAFLASAGVRIRYNRFRDAWRDGSVQWTFVTIGELQNTKDFSADVYLFVKTFSPAALILMAHLSAMGKAVAQDIFDDYFSQNGDARLARFRFWLRQAAPFTDVAMCTTHRLASVLRPYLPATRIVPVDDPVVLSDRAVLDSLLRDKLARMRRTRRVRTLWFGIGDNPYFPVGLQDLLARADALVRLNDAGWHVKLEVMTNDRALNAATLARLRQFPLPLVLTQWSEQAETAALEAADLVFLPVAAQSFSMGKSLNRAMAAIAHGCQVLSPAYPLYDRLEPVIYNAENDLILDLARGRLRLDPAALDRNAALLHELADQKSLAAAFVAALASVAREKMTAQATPGRVCVIHGAGAVAAEHKLAIRLRALSIGTPFQALRLNYDLRFDVKGGRLAMLVHQPLTDRINPAFVPAGPPRRILDRDFIAVVDQQGEGTHLPLNSVSSTNPAARAVAYPVVMREIVRRIERLFPGAAIVLGGGDALMQAAQV